MTNSIALTRSEPSFRDAAPVMAVRACAACGAPVEPPDRFCPSCGSEQPLSAEVVPAAEQKYFRCQGCGSEVKIDPDQRSYVCPFCTSSYVVEFSPDVSRRQPPEFVIGFAVTADQAMETFRRWLATGSLFRPADLRSASFAGNLRGVYLPFWSFSMLAQSRWSASIGEHWYRTETYTTTENGKTVTKTRTVQETEWWPLEGRHHEFHSGYLVSGSRGLGQRDAQRIQPFHLPALKRYEPRYLAGWLCEEYSVEREEALRACQAEFARREEAAVAAFLPGDTHSNLAVATEFSQVNSDLVLLPVYLLSYRYRNRVYRFLMNGQTGQCDGDKPISGWRIAAVVLGVMVVVGLVVGLVALVGAIAGVR